MLQYFSLQSFNSWNDRNQSHVFCCDHSSPEVQLSVQMCKYKDICSSDNTLPLQTTAVAQQYRYYSILLSKRPYCLCLLVRLCYDYNSENQKEYIQLIFELSVCFKQMFSCGNLFVKKYVPAWGTDLKVENAE